MASEHSIDLHLLSSQQGAESGLQQIRGGVNPSAEKFAEALKSEQQDYNKTHKNQIDGDRKANFGQAGEVSATGSVPPTPETDKSAITRLSPPADLTGLVNLLSAVGGSNGQSLPAGGKSLPAGVELVATAGLFMSDKFVAGQASLTAESGIDAALAGSPVKAVESAKTINEASLLDKSLSDRMVAGNIRLSSGRLMNLQTTRTGQATNPGGVNASSAAPAVSAVLPVNIALENSSIPTPALTEKPSAALVSAQPVTENLHQLVSRLRLADSRAEVGEGTRTASATVIQEGQWLASGDAGRQLFATQLAASQLAGSGDNTAMQVEFKPSSGSQLMLTPYSLPGSGLGASVGRESAAIQFQTAMGTQFGQPAWQTELGQHARMMVRENLRFAEIELKPARLGTIEILVTQEKDQTSLMFFTKNPVVRDALEAGLLRLQKSFSEDGLNLGNTQVSDQSLSEHREQQKHASGQQQSADLQSDSVAHSAQGSGSQQVLSTLPEGMVDTWA